PIRGDEPRVRVRCHQPANPRHGPQPRGGQAGRPEETPGARRHQDLHLRDGAKPGRVPELLVRPGALRVRILKSERLDVVDNGPASEHTGDGDEPRHQNQESPPAKSELPQLPHSTDPMCASRKMASGKLGTWVERRLADSAK